MPAWDSALRLARRYGPTVYRELKKSGLIDKGREAVGGRLGSGQQSADHGAPGPRNGHTPAGRPITNTANATESRARRIEYSPKLDGEADPGEIVWTWVAYEEDAGQGKDRPVLVVGRDNAHLLGLMLSSQSHRADDANWQAIGSGSWDHDHRPSYVRLDRILDVPEHGIRREGAIVPRDRFDSVADRLRREYGWS